MKKSILLVLIFTCSYVFAQDDISSKNSWFKAGITAGVPIGDTADVSSFNLGLDFRGQYLVNPNFAIGVASGYNHFFGKDGADDFGIIPLAGFLRYYFSAEGLFVGTDIGYGFLTNVDNNEGGLLLSPHIGYHNYNWNFYVYYQRTSTDASFDVESIGIGAKYNLRFK